MEAVGSAHLVPLPLRRVRGLMAAKLPGCSDSGLIRKAPPRPTWSIHLASEGAWIPVESRKLKFPFSRPRKGDQRQTFQQCDFISDFVNDFNLDLAIPQVASSTSDCRLWMLP